MACASRSLQAAQQTLSQRKSQPRRILLQWSTGLSPWLSTLSLFHQHCSVLHISCDSQDCCCA